MSNKQKIMLYRIAISAGLFIVLLVLQLSHKLDQLPEWARFCMFLIPYLIIGYDVIGNAFRSIRNGIVFEEHFLMMVATFAAFALVFFGRGEYPEAVAVMLFYQIGEFFQSYALGKSRQSVSALMELAPESAFVLNNGNIEEVDPDDVSVGDIIIIRPGEKIPLDGVVIEGSTYLNTSALTGESVPRRVSPGDSVISGCLNGESTIRVQVMKPYEDSTISRILELVENASSQKARLENFITRFARYYTPIVTILAVILAIFIGLIGNGGWAEGVRRACNFLIVSCPCALVISVPLGFFGGIGAASRNGILIKGSNYLEAASRIRTLVMDKTGTLTEGTFRVVKVQPSQEKITSETELLEIASSAESYSSHPIARSILEAYEKDPDLTKIRDLEEIPGQGIKAFYQNKPLLVGNGKLMASSSVPYESTDEAGTVVYIALDNKYLGYILISDTIKENAKDTIYQLSQLGINRMIILTGDSKVPSDAVAHSLGIEEVHSGLLPTDKVELVREIIYDEHKKSNRSTVGFIGDGINDAPVLMQADVGFAMGSLGSDAAIEAADIVIMDDDIQKIASTIQISRKTMKIVYSNIIFALAVKILILILSALGIASMWAAVFGDVGVAILCVLNSMRVLNTKV